VITGALNEVRPARYLLTAIVSLESGDGLAHRVRCGILGDDGVTVARSPEVTIDPAAGEPATLAWNGIDAVGQGTVSVACRISDCGGVVYVLDTRIAATASE